MQRTHFCTIGAALLLTVAGCTSTTPNLDRHFGQGLNLAKAQQTLDPQAGRNLDPVSGIDAKAAKSAYDGYQKSFRMPAPQPNAFTIGVGTR